MKSDKETKTPSDEEKLEQSVPESGIDNTRKNFGQRVVHAILHPIDAWKQSRD